MCKRICVAFSVFNANIFIKRDCCWKLLLNFVYFFIYFYYYYFMFVCVCKVGGKKKLCITLSINKIKRNRIDLTLFDLISHVALLRFDKYLIKTRELKKDACLWAPRYLHLVFISFFFVWGTLTVQMLL